LVQAQIDKCSPAVGSTSACSALAKFERNAWKSTHSGRRKWACWGRRGSGQLN
jgi:hypothetical protein